MAIRDYLSQTAEVWRLTPGAPDAYGKPAATWAQVGTCRGRLELRDGKEIKDGVEIVVTRHRWFMEPMIAAMPAEEPVEGEPAPPTPVAPGDLRETDRLKIGNETYEVHVIAPRRGRLSQVHHLDVTLWRLR